MAFHLCPDCLAKYRALQFDPNASISPCLIPFGSIIWSDEHDRANVTATPAHERCLHSLMRLTTARKDLWRTGQLRPAFQQLWHKAQELMPNWPGFKRLVLTAEDLRALDYCETETRQLMAEFRHDVSIFAVEDCGDGVMKFISHPSPPPSTGALPATN